MGFRRVVVALLAGAVALGASGCMGGDDDSGGGDKAAAKYDGKPVTITLWTGFSDRELNVIKGVTEDFHKQNPKITVKVLGSRRRRQDHRRGARAQLAPRRALVLHRQHRRVLLVGRLDQASALHGPGRPERRRVPGVGAELHQVRGQPVQMPPMLADVYGLYYNKDLLAKAGIKEPPKTFDELAADAKKLTQRSSDGTIEVAGYVPTWGFDQNQAAHYAPQFDAHWTDDQGNSTPVERPGLDEDAQVEQGAGGLVRLRQARPLPGRRRRRVLRAERLRARQDRDDDRRRVPDGVHRERAPGAQLRDRADGRWTTTRPTCTAAAT